MYRYSVYVLLLVVLAACGSAAPQVAQPVAITQPAPTDIPPTAQPTLPPEAMDAPTTQPTEQAAPTATTKEPTTTEAATEIATETATEATTAATAFPLTISDGLGREVTLTTPAERVVSLAPSNTEILFAVGAGERVVGVTKYCNYPAEAQTRTQIGGFSAKTISIEAIVALKPDLVLAGDESHQPVIEALEQLQIPVVALKATTFDDVYRNIGLVGQVTGHDAEATTIVDQMQQRVAAVTAQVAEIPIAERLTVYWEVFDEPLTAAGPTTYIGQVIDLAGGVNIFADVAEEYPQVSAEEIVRRNPAAILGPDAYAAKLTPEIFAQRPGWSDIAAVRDGRILLIDGDMVSRSGPRLADALEAVAAALYPEHVR